MMSQTSARVSAAMIISCLRNDKAISFARCCRDGGSKIKSVTIRNGAKHRTRICLCHQKVDWAVLIPHLVPKDEEGHEAQHGNDDRQCDGRESELQRKAFLHAGNADAITSRYIQIPSASIKLSTNREISGIDGR